MFLLFTDSKQHKARERDLITLRNHATIVFFTITAEIHVHSVANFYCQYADIHMNLKLMRRQRARAGNSTICYRKKQIDVSF